MFTDHNIITILFRLINFAALIALFTYIFKKMGKPEILSQIQQAQNDKDSLYFQQTTLELQQRNLDLLIKNDAQLQEKCKYNIDIWKEAVVIQHEKNLQQYTLTKEKYSQKCLAKAILQQEHHLQTTVTQAVINDLEKSLSLYFHNEKNRQKYLTKIIHFMEEKAL